MMPTKAKSNEQRKAGAAARLALLAGLLAAALTVPAAATSPWESIATMIRNKAANAATTASLTTKTATQARPAEAVPVVGGVPDEVAVTSGSQPRVMGSAALAALLKMTTGTLKATPTAGKKPSGGKGKDEKAIDLGRESDENEALLATNLFKNKDILRLLGDQPRFIYDPQNRPDPMIVPWVRQAAIFKELSALAEEYSNNNETDKAVAVYQRILQMNDPRYNALIHEKLQAIADKQNAQAVALIQQTQAVEEKVELPAWVQDNTTGVIVSSGETICLVGEFMLHPGDKVPTYPEVTVASITSKKVIYQIKNRSFEVNLKTN